MMIDCKNEEESSRSAQPQHLVDGHRQQQQEQQQHLHTAGRLRRSARRSISALRREFVQITQQHPFISTKNSGIGSILTCTLSRALDYILFLPHELQCLIILQLNQQDLLALRQTSRAFHGLVDDCAPSIIRKYVKQSKPQYVKLYRAPSTDQVSIQWLLGMMHRQNVSKNLSALASDFFRGHLLGMSKRKGKRFQVFFDRMADSLQPMFFTLLHFFETYRCMILERATMRSKVSHGFNISTGGPTLWDDQLSILQQYVVDEMLDCYHVYGFLLHVIEHQLSPPRFDKLIGSLTRSKVIPASTGEVEVLLILGGLGQVRRVLSQPCWRSRRAILDGFIEGLKPTPESDWKRTWSSLHIESDIFSLDNVPKLRLTLPALHLVWVPSVLKLLVDNDSIDSVDYESGNPVAGRDTQTPVDFICDLLRDTVLGGGGANDEDDSHVGNDDGPSIQRQINV